jgi:murein DD-endopeptidase MepM/ murein hydrolase activator NlpD
LREKLILWLVIVSIVISLNTVYADKTNELQDELTQINRDIKNAQNMLSSIKTQKNSVLLEKEEIEKSIETAEKELDEIDKLLKISEQKIGSKQKELLTATERSENQYELLKKRVRVMYEQGDVSYLEIILQSATFSDFLARIEMIKDIIEYDEELFIELETNKNLLLKIKRELQAEQVKKEKLKEGIIEKTNELDENVKVRGEILEELTSQQGKYLEALNELEETSKKIGQELKKLQELNKRKYAGGKLEWPCFGYYEITSPYGYRIHPITKTKKLHTGIDIAAPYDAEVTAANDGVVVYSGWNGGYGKCVIIDHGGGIATLYGHNNSILVNVNDEVKKGDLISKVGSTGLSTGPHLHFEVRENGSTVNPMSYFN